MFTEARYQSEEAAREYLESLRWPTGVVCPHCGVIGEHYPLKGASHRPGLWCCKDCREQFTVTVGSVFERSKVPLTTWLKAFYLIASSKKGMSSHQLHRMLGVTYKTAWFMSHRIREAMSSPGGMLGGGGKPVEVDETYWGNVGKQRQGARGGDHKMKVVSLVERDGNKRSFHVSNVTAKTLRPILRKSIKRDTHLMTDEARVYKPIGRKYFDAHSSVNHSAEKYVRVTGDTIATTNTVESSFALLKRGLYGTFHHVGEQHLQRYADEFDFRWNHRKVTDAQRADAALRGAPGKRLTYRRIDG